MVRRAGAIAVRGDRRTRGSDVQCVGSGWIALGMRSAREQDERRAREERYGGSLHTASILV
jgi:hypothetical protein